MKYVVKRLPSDELAHHGVKGQRWGVRNYQNEDGTLTSQGRNHYGVGDGYDKYRNPNGSLNERGKIRYDKTKQYVTKHEKSVGSRIGRTIGGGAAGGLIGSLTGGALIGGGSLAAFLAAGGSLTAANLGAFGVIGAAGAIASVPLMAAGVLGGLTITGLKHAHQARKVKKGKQFMDKFGS